MKILFIYFLLIINSLILLIFLINLFLFKILFNPINQLINLILFTIFICLNLYSIKPSSLLFIFIILIIVIRGIIILFSYLICLINISKIKKTKFKFFYFIIYSFIFISIKINFQIFIKKFIIFNNIFFLNSLIKLFYFPNILIFFLIILFLILILIISSNIWFIKKNHYEINYNEKI